MDLDVLKLKVAVRLLRRVIPSLAVTVACAALLSACGSSASTTSSTTNTKLDTRRVAVAIEQSIRQERHVRAKVICPTSVPQQKGKTFFCIASTESGGKRVSTPFSVTVQNSQGYVTYKAE
ncbi:MAG TPA: hypothetical protein VFW38_01235 [Solirubrobacteraceae bacterium]|nr:hypothetical protein [Solirubrobacteraceae bacterium]